MPRLKMFLLIFGIATAFCRPAGARTWTDISGQFSRDGEFVSLDENQVRLRQTDGKEISIPLERLSLADRAMIQPRAVDQTDDPFQDSKRADEQPRGTALRSMKVAYESLPTPVAISQIPSPPPAIDSVPGDDYRVPVGIKPCKYVYSGCYGTFHLLDFGPRNGIGTAYYSICCDHDCCDDCHSHCCSRKWYLALLRKTHEDCTFFYYRPQYGDCCIDECAFSRCPDCCNCEYSVWYHLRGEPATCWHKLECACRTRPC